jgi:hypothetical protein
VRFSCIGAQRYNMIGSYAGLYPFQPFFKRIRNWVYETYPLLLDMTGLKKLIPYLLLLLLAAFWLVRYHSGATIAFNREVKQLVYTRHAKCRMACRHITPGEVEEVLHEGTINPRKSDLQDRPCPTFALEGYTRIEHQHVRIIFAQCEQTTKVVTCIDLEHEFSCDCQ